MAARRDVPAPMKEPAVLDTDVLSYFFKEDSRADSYRPLIAGKYLIISFMTIAETERWALANHWGERKISSLRRFVSRFACVPSDEACCRAWARVTQDSRKAGRPIGCADAWIAATAICCDAPLITNNSADYAGVTGLEVLTAT